MLTEDRRDRGTEISEKKEIQKKHRMASKKRKVEKENSLFKYKHSYLLFHFSTIPNCP